HTDSVLAITWNPTATRLMSGSTDFTARLWDVESYTNSALRVFDYGTEVSSIGWSPDNSKLMVYTFGNELYLYNSQNYELIRRGLGGAISGVVWSPDQQFIALETVGSFSATLDANTLNHINELYNFEVDGDKSYGIYTIAWGFNTSRIAGGTYGGGIVI